MGRRIEVLGGFALISNGATIVLRSRKAQALVALLGTARARRLPRAHLAELLWEGRGTDQALTSLRQALAQIRRSTGEGWIETESDFLHLSEDISIDAEDMRVALSNANAAEAVRLYRGPFLAGLRIVGNDLTARIAAERADFAALALTASQAELERLSGQPEAEAAAHRVLAHDPLHEQAHRALMRVEAARGSRRAALERYAKLEALLDRELAAAPEDETRALADRLRSGRGKSHPSPDIAAKTNIRTQTIVLVALETDHAVDWTAVRDKLLAGGARVLAQGAGEQQFIWDGDARPTTLRAMVGLTLEVARMMGTALSFGMISDEAGTGGGSVDLLRRARRFAAASEPGTIAISRAMLQQVGLDPHTAAPVVPGAFRLNDAVPVPRAEVPFVGREPEIAQIEAVAHIAARNGRGLVIHISGEAGIGKSRLSIEAATRLTAGGSTNVIVRFEAFGTQPRHLAQRIFTALPQLLADANLANPYDRALFTWLAQAPRSTETELRLSALSEEERNRRMLDLLCAALAQNSGSVLTIEDLHWAPPGACDFVLDLSDRLAHLPVILIVTERPHDGSMAPRLGVRSQCESLRISLPPLSPDATAALAGSLAGDATRQKAAIAAAQGHPLFLLRLLEAGWSDGPLPDNVTGLVLEQMERLPEPERDALQRAAILGPRIDPSVLIDIFPGLPAPTASGDLLIQTGATVMFGHDLVYRAVHDSIPEAQRISWHDLAAAYFAEVDAVRWADHALLGSDDAEASRAAAAAANVMISDRRYGAAQPYIAAGLERGGDAEAVAELHSCRAGIRRIRGDLHGALDAYRAAFASATTDPTRVAMLVRRALVLHRLDRGPEADRTLDDAQAIADASGLGGMGRAEIHEQRGNRAFVRGDAAECAKQHGLALVAAEKVGDPRGIARAHGGLGDAAYAAGRIATAYHHFDRAVRLAETNGLGVVHEDYAFMRAFSLFFARPGPEAHLLADIAVDSAQQSGAGRAEMLARETRAEMRLAAGDLDGLREDIARLAILLDQDPERRFSGDLQILRAALTWREGDAMAAWKLLAPLMKAVADDPYNGPMALGLAACLAPDAARRDAAITAGNARVKAGALSHATLWFHRLVLERTLRDGDAELSLDQINRLRSYTHHEPLGFSDLVIRSAERALQEPEPASLLNHNSKLREVCLADFEALSWKGKQKW